MERYAILVDAGYFFAVHDPAKLAEADIQVQTLREAGASAELLEGQALSQRLGSPFYRAAIWCRGGNGLLQPAKYAKGLLEALPGSGFIVSSTGGVTRVEKYGCGAEFRRTSDDHYLMTILPTIVMNGQFTRLWDAGYQKFLLTDDGRKFPATADQLLRMRRFNEEVRTALGVPTYYNEALGSTSQVSVYDRVKGRTGDDPDRTVGVKSTSGH